MTEKRSSASASPINVQELWAKYEDIAMHFNDLLMRLRSQSLAAIAALSTVVGVLANAEKANLSVSWLVATLMFMAMSVFWVAVWCLDFLYYNRLLRGAVAALAKIEQETQSGKVFRSGIYMSTYIVAEFNQPVMREDVAHFQGVIWFYRIVLGTLLVGAMVCGWMHIQEKPASAPCSVQATTQNCQTSLPLAKTNASAAKVSISPIEKKKEAPPREDHAK